MPRTNRVDAPAALIFVIAALAACIATPAVLDPSSSVLVESPTPDVPTESGAGVRVTTAIVPDRFPGPLQGRTWAATGPTGLVIGALGDATRLVFPASQVLLGISHNLVVTGSPTSDEISTVITFVAWSTGDEALPPATVPGQLVTAVVAGDTLFATGFGVTPASDPGLVAISLVDGSVRVAIPRGLTPAEVGRPVARNVLVSPSGRTVVSSLCTPSGCTGGTIIDAVTGVIRGSLAAADGPSSINDQVALVRRGGDITNEIALIDLVSGAEGWRQQADEYTFGYVTDAGDVVILLSRGNSADLARISRPGVERDSGPLPGHQPSLWVELSSSSLAVIGDGGPFPGAAGADGVVKAVVFDLGAWSLSPDTIEVDIDGQP